MTDQERAVLKQALEALEATHYDVGSAEKQRLQAMDAITALRAALAQQEPALVGWSPEQCRQLLDTALAQEQQEQQEPVAWVDEASIAWLAEHPRGIITTRLVLQKSPERQMPLYTAPPRRETEQEPVAWIQSNHLQQARREPFLCRVEPTQRLSDFVPLYTHPPRREWQSLSEEEIQLIHDTYHKRMGPQEFARAIEAALKEKNQ